MKRAVQFWVICLILAIFSLAMAQGPATAGEADPGTTTKATTALTAVSPTDSAAGAWARG